MKNLLILVVLLGATDNLLGQSKSDEFDMRMLARNFMIAYNQQDHVALQRMYLDYAARIESNGRTISGAENIAAYFFEQFQRNNVTLIVQQSKLYWSSAQHAFIAEGIYEIFGNNIVYNLEIHVHGTYSNTMMKDRDGQWKIAKSVLTPLTASSLEEIGLIDRSYKALATDDISPINEAWPSDRQVRY